MYDKSLETIVNAIIDEIHYYLLHKYSGLTKSGINNVINNGIISSDINSILSILADLQSDVEDLVSFYYERENIE